MFPRLQYIVPVGSSSSTIGERSREPVEFRVRLTHVNSINPEYDVPPSLLD